MRWQFSGRRVGKREQALREMMDALDQGVGMRVYIPDLRLDSPFLKSLRRRKDSDVIDIEGHVVEEPKGLLTDGVD